MAVSAVRFWRYFAVVMLAMGCGKGVFAADLNTALDMVRKGQAAEAVAIFRVLAAEGDSTAQVNLAVMHAIGEGVPLDEVEAAYWAWRARLMGDRRAARQSDLLLERLPVKSRNEMATRLSDDLKRLAEEGQPQAFLALGRLQTEVKSPPKPRNASIWYTIAAAFEVPHSRVLRDVSNASLSEIARVDVQQQARAGFLEWCQRVPAEIKPASCPLTAIDEAAESR